MALYSAVVVFVTIVVFYVNLVFFSRTEILNKNRIFIISMVSVMISISFPMVLSGFMKTSTSSNFYLALFTSIITCLVLIIIASSIISGISEDKKLGNPIISWSIGNVSQKLKKQHFLQGSIESETAGIIEFKELPSTTQGKNILEKSVDTDKNTDTMGIETFDNESLFVDGPLAIQTKNMTIECNSEIIENPDSLFCDSSSNSTENNESDSFNDDYEVFKDYFEEEVLEEYLQVESKYCDEISQIDENSEVDEVDLVSLIHDEVSFEGVLQKDSPSGSEDEYDPTVNDQLENTDEVFELVAAHMDEPDDNCKVADVEMTKQALSKTVDEIIDEAFNLKENGDFEGAILNYFYALEREPKDDVVFWVVLDICVLYKQLGQVDLAKDVLNSYLSEYGEIMNETVRHEIELNLQ